MLPKLFRVCCRSLLLPTLLLLLVVGPASGQSVAPQDIARRALPSVLLLLTLDEARKPLTIGSAFVVAPGVVAASYHILHKAKWCLAKRVNQDTVFIVEKGFSHDMNNDLALLKIPDLPAEAQPLPLSSTMPTAGQPVYAIGNPRGMEGTISVGRFEAVREMEGTRLLQISAPIASGSSGGPVLDEYGKVIGVTTKIRGEHDSNLALPVDSLCLLMEKVGLIATKTVHEDQLTRSETNFLHSLPESQGTLRKWFKKARS